MAKKVLEDTKDGAVYHLDHVAALQPAPIKGDRTDQYKVTHVNTIIHTVGGAVLHTAIPFDEAREFVDAAWADELPATPATPADDEQG